MNPKSLQTERSFSAPTSFLFTFRLWQTRDAQGDAAWCGKLEAVMTGQVRYLNDLQGVAAELRALLDEMKQQAHSMEENNVS